MSGWLVLIELHGSSTHPLLGLIFPPTWRLMQRHRRNPWRLVIPDRRCLGNNATCPAALFNIFFHSTNTLTFQDGFKKRRKDKGLLTTIAPSGTDSNKSLVLCFPVPLLSCGSRHQNEWMRHTRSSCVIEQWTPKINKRNEIRSDG